MGRNAFGFAALAAIIGGVFYAGKRYGEGAMPELRKRVGSVSASASRKAAEMRSRGEAAMADAGTYAAAAREELPKAASAAVDAVKSSVSAVAASVPGQGPDAE